MRVLVFVQVLTITYCISAVPAISRPPLSLLSAVSSRHDKGELSTLLIIRAMRVASTMKVAHIACAIALPLSIQTIAVGAQIEFSISCCPVG